MVLIKGADFGATNSVGAWKGMDCLSREREDNWKTVPSGFKNLSHISIGSVRKKKDILLHHVFRNNEYGSKSPPRHRKSICV